MDQMLMRNTRWLWVVAMKRLGPLVAPLVFLAGEGCFAKPSTTLLRLPCHSWVVSPWCQTLVQSLFRFISSPFQIICQKFTFAALPHGYRSPEGAG
jgi:hypothetical protein